MRVNSTEPVGVNEIGSRLDGHFESSRDREGSLGSGRSSGLNIREDSVADVSLCDDSSGGTISIHHKSVARMVLDKGSKGIGCWVGI